MCESKLWLFCLFLPNQHLIYCCWLYWIATVAADSILEAAIYLDMKSIEDVGLDMDPEAGDVDKVEYISVYAVLDVSSGLGLNLPVYIKFSSCVHNLDANKALDSALFKSANKKAMSKAQWLWNL